MSDYTQKYYELEALIKERVPGFKVKFKDQSTFMKIIGKIMFFNKRFMTDFTTTLGKTVYFPSRAKFDRDPGAYFYTLAHEYVHVMDYVARPFIFFAGYAFPQILSLFSLFAFFAFLNPYFLLFLIALLFAAPIPAPFRTWVELRGYGMNCKVRLWDGWSEKSVQNEIGWYTKAFTTSAYYFMCPFKTYITKKLMNWAKPSNDECLSYKNPAYIDVHNILTK